MRYSLINVSKEYDGYVDGTWLQDSAGNFEQAVKRARDTEMVNDSRITVAVVDGLSSYIPDYSYKRGLKRLDKSNGVEAL